MIGSYSGSNTPPDTFSSGPTMYVEFVSDQYVTGGGFQATYSRQYQGADVLPCTSSHAYTLTEPHDAFGCNGYGNSVSMSWHINDSSAEHVVLTFDFMDTESRYDVVKVYDGSDTTAALLGTYSGTDLPAPLTASSGHMYITFTSDYSINSAGFSASYDSLISTADPCYNSTHITTATHEGFIGCPYGYGNNVDSEWSINALTDFIIRVDFLSFNTEASYDYVRIYDGPTTSDPLVGSYSGSSLPPAFTSASNNVLITFHSDGSVRGNGFTATYSTVERPSGVCFDDGQYIFTEAQGSFGCDQYGPNVQITWELHAQENQDNNQVVNVAFPQFDLASGDSVTIYDGSSTSSTVLATYTGSEIPEGAVSTGETMLVAFSSDGSSQGSGFTATYMSVDGPSNAFSDCSHSQSYTIQENSGNFGCDQYSPSVTVTWAILVDQGFEIQIDFDFFYTETSYDVVKVYDGPTTSYDILATLSGSYTPEPLQSSSNSVLVVFTSDGSVQRPGFSASFNTIQGHVDDDCHSSGTVPTMTEPEGTFGCDSYGPSVTKTWTINLSEGLVQLNFVQFSTEHNYDFVTVYDGTTSSSPQLLRTSGNSIPDPILSSGSAMTVVFTSDSSVQYAGFLAEYFMVQAEQTCDTSESYIIDNASEGSFGCEGYGNSVDSSWLLEAAANMKLSLSFSVFDTESYYDYVRVYDGANSDATRLGSFYGNTIPAPVVSTGNSLYVTFHSDSSVSASYAGFSANYATFGTTLENCDTSETTTLTASSGVFGCDGYHNQVSMSWYIMPGHGCIALSFESFNTESGYDVVSVYNGSSTSSQTLGQFSGSSIPHNVVSTGSSMTVTFVSDYSVNAAGFTAQYQVVSC